MIDVRPTLRMVLRFNPRTRVLLLLSVVAMAAGFFWLGNRAARRQPSQCPVPPPALTLQAPAPPPGATKAPQLPPNTFTVAQILDDYAENEAAAERKYNGHPYHVLAAISQVHDVFGAPVLELRGVDLLGRTSDFFVLNAFMTKESMPAASHLRTGDTVLLRCSQSRKVGTPFIGGCVFEGMDGGKEPA